MDDLYSLLGVSKNATQEEIKSTFYSKAKLYHPDLPANKDNIEVQKKFQEISSAYDVCEPLLLTSLSLTQPCISVHLTF